jgi:hypothetical protein
MTLLLTLVKLKQSCYTPWRRLGGEEYSSDSFSTSALDYDLEKLIILLFTPNSSIDFSIQLCGTLSIIIIIIIIIISYHRFSFFPGTSPLEPAVNPTTQASSLSL